MSDYIKSGQFKVGENPKPKPINNNKLGEDYEYDDGMPRKISLKRERVNDFWLDGASYVDYNLINKFLNSRVGKKWDDVWSEICHKHKGYNGLRVREAFEYTVETKPEFVNGRAMKSKWGFKYESEYYVKDGILCKQKVRHWRQKYKRKPRKDIYELDGQDYYKHDGIWYRVKIKKIKPIIVKSYKRYEVDVFDKNPMFKKPTPKYKDGKPYMITWKQQANSKECKKLEQLV